MRHHRLFAAGLAAALMLGAASPAMAKSDNGKGHGKDNAPGHTKPNPNKGPKAGVSGGGEVGTAEFSIQARKKNNGQHFNWTDGTFSLRCRGAFTNTSTAAGSVDVAWDRCTATGQAAPFALTVHVIDAGQHAATAKDRVTFTLPAASVETGGDLTGGNVKIRP